MGTRPAITAVAPLELTMREVLEDMADLTAEFAWHSTEDTFEIITIEPADAAGRVSRSHPFTGKGAAAGR